MDINTELATIHLNSKINRTKTDNHVKTNVCCLYDFFCLNNIKICEKIKEIYNLSNKYYIINDYTLITIGEITEKIYSYNADNLNNANKYVLLEYNTVKHLDFNNFLFNLPNPKLFIFHVLDSYNFLLNSLLNLEHISVCFFNLSTKNIIFDKNYKPILQNFGTSLLLEKCSDINYFIKIIEKIEDYTYKPIEIHVVFYLIKNNENSLSFAAIDSICNNFVKNMSVLSLFSQQYKENYYKSSVDYLKKYINKTKVEIITEIIKHSSTWDNYELSTLYLHIIGNIIRVFSLKGNLLTKLINVLSKNISPNPINRESLFNSIEKINSLYCEFTDWEYINSIPKEKINKLYENLLK